MAETIEKMEIMNAAQGVHLVLKMKETAIVMLIAKGTLSVGKPIVLLIGAHLLGHFLLIVANQSM